MKHTEEFSAAASEQALGPGETGRKEGTGLKKLLSASLQVGTNSLAPTRSHVLWTFESSTAPPPNPTVGVWTVRLLVRTALSLFCGLEN